MHNNTLHEGKINKLKKKVVVTL